MYSTGNSKFPTEYLIAVVLGLLVFLLYLPVIHFDFINYDDFDYVAANAHVNKGLSMEAVKWAFFSFHASNWHPVTWLSHMLDCQLFGLNAGWHHLTNLFFHLANTLLLFALFCKLTRQKWPATCVALLFAVHPLHVESVAWIAERKDMLSTFFFLTVLMTYTSYVRSPKKTALYYTTLFLFMLGLMAKPMLVTLPFLLLVLDYWPLERFRLPARGTLFADKKVLQNMIVEKIPFFLLSGISSYITVCAQKSAIAAEGLYPLKFRLINAVIAYGTYIRKMFVPVHLSLPYPIEDKINWASFWISLAVLLLISLISLSTAKKRPYILAGWLWYLGTLVPVIGILQVGIQSMADRYTYIPLIGLFIMLTWGCNDICKRWKYLKFPAIVGLGIICILLTAATRHQLGFWQNSISLFRHSLKATDNNYVADNNLGLALMEQGNMTDSAKYFTDAIRINPGFSLAYLNLAYNQASRHEDNKAIENYRKALSIDPNYVEAYCNLGNLYFRQGRYQEASENYLAALKIQPDSAQAYDGLGGVFTRIGNLDKAIFCFQKALSFAPDDASTRQNLVEVYCNIGNLAFRQNQYQEASENYLAALKIQPDSAQAYNGLGAVFTRIGNLDKAIFCFKKALSLRPDDVSARQNLENLMKSKSEEKLNLHK